MCERWVLGLMLATLPLASASAQVLDTARLHRKADSLLVLWREAYGLSQVQAAAREARDHRATQIARATAAIRGQNPVQSGGLMVIADYPDSIPLREASARAWNILSRTYGSHAASLVQQPIRLAVVFSERQRVAMPDARRVPHRVTVDELERTLMGMTGQPAIDRRFSRWLGNTVQPVFDTGAARTNVYTQMVTAGSVAARHCFEGALSDCATALGLDEDSDFFLSAYDAAERRVLVASTSARSRIEPAEVPAFDRCVDQRVDSACVVFLRGLDRNQIPKPLSFEARNLLVSTATEIGGAEAYTRLNADSSASVRDRLSRAAGVPIDRVVATWRSEVLAARPPRNRVPTRDALFALGWVALFTTGAVRSTRWRLT